MCITKFFVMDTREKKFFVAFIKTYDYDLTKRWRIEWEKPIRNGLKSSRVVKYGNINNGTTVDERLKYANDLIARLGLNKGSALILPRKKTRTDILNKAIELNSMQWRKSTVRAYKTVVKYFLTFLAGLPPENVTAATINDFILHLRANNASANTIVKYRNLLHTVYTKAIEFSLTETNSISRIKVKKIRPKSLKFFNDEQIELLKNANMPGEL